MSSKRSKAMILNRIFHIFAMIGVARMTSNGSVSHVLLVYNLLKHFYSEFRRRSQDTDIIMPRNCSETASLMPVAKENALPSNRCYATLKSEWLHP